MENQDNIQLLRNVIYENLDALIDGDYCLLDFPNHGNIGDHLIWQGELDFLKRLPYKCNYQCSFALCDYNRISENDIILLHGGGNFGDLYRPIQEFRLRIVEKFPNNKIIFLPQTIHYNNEEVLIADINSLNKHNNLTICVRDTNSYSLIKNRLVKPSLLLLPDMAFCVDLTRFHTNANNNRKLFLKRTDKELALQSFEFESSESIDILDWPSYKKQLENILFDLIGVISKKMFRIEQARKFMNHKTGFLPYALREKQLISGINFINQYPEIYSNRLHGFILAILLNKKVFLLDNNYGKNSSYYNTWMQSFTNLLIIK